MKLSPILQGHACGTPEIQQSGNDMSKYKLQGRIYSNPTSVQLSLRLVLNDPLGRVTQHSFGIRLVQVVQDPGLSWVSEASVESQTSTSGLILIEVQV